MEKICVAVIVTCCCSSLSAQPIMTNANAPQPGTSYTLKYADSTGITAGPGGANQNWNFDLSIFSFGAESKNYIVSTGTPFDTLFPNGNLVTPEFNDSVFTYYASTPAEFSIVGVGTLDGFTELYGDPQTYRIFPFEYLDEHTDSFQSTISFMGNNGSKYGWIHNTYDAYGALTINDTEYSNAIRLHSIFEITTVADTNLFVYYADSYEWYTANSPVPVLNIADVTITINDNVGFDKFVKVLETASAISEQDRQPSLFFQNPVAQGIDVKVDIRSEHSLIGYCELYDMLGHLIDKVSLDKNQTELKTAALPAGVYLVRFTSESGVTQSSKLVIY